MSKESAIELIEERQYLIFLKANILRDVKTLCRIHKKYNSAIGPDIVLAIMQSMSENAEDIDTTLNLVLRELDETT